MNEKIDDFNSTFNYTCLKPDYNNILIYKLRGVYSIEILMDCFLSTDFKWIVCDFDFVQILIKCRKVDMDSLGFKNINASKSHGF